jgi:putative membrane protein insertion efficiency factor
MLTLINGASPTLLSDVGRIRPCVPVAVPFLEAARMPVQHEKSAIPLNFAAQFGRAAVRDRTQGPKSGQYLPPPGDRYRSDGNSMTWRNQLKETLTRVKRTPRRAARALITAYRYTLSALVGFECRHLPTCSAYADEAIDRFGLWAGGWMTLARLGRCHPLGTSGLDFVPSELPSDARWYLPWRYGLWRSTNPGTSAASDRAP